MLFSNHLIDILLYSNALFLGTLEHFFNNSRNDKDKAMNFFDN